MLDRKVPLTFNKLCKLVSNGTWRAVHIPCAFPRIVGATSQVAGSYGKLVKYVRCRRNKFTHLHQLTVGIVSLFRSTACTTMVDAFPGLAGNRWKVLMKLQFNTSRACGILLSAGFHEFHEFQITWKHSSSKVLPRHSATTSYSEF